VVLPLYSLLLAVMLPIAMARWVISPLAACSVTGS
jgi:hypothetical protein